MTRRKSREANQARIREETEQASLLVIALENLKELSELPEGQVVQAGKMGYLGLLVHEIPYTLTMISRADPDTINRYEAREEPFTNATLSLTAVHREDPKFIKYEGMLEEFARRCNKYAGVSA